MNKRLIELSERFFSDPDDGGDYLSLQELYELLYLQRLRIEKAREAEMNEGRLRELSQCYFNHPDEGGDYLSVEELNELLHLQRLRIEKACEQKQAVMEVLESTEAKVDEAREAARECWRVIYEASDKPISDHECSRLGERWPWLEE
jgi:hypothetical protein